MSRRKNKKRNRKQQANKPVQKQEVIEVKEEVPVTDSVSEKTIHPLIQKILDGGEYEIIGDMLRQRNGDVGFTINDEFIEKLENSDYLAKFIPHDDWQGWQGVSHEEVQLKCPGPLKPKEKQEEPESGPQLVEAESEETVDVVEDDVTVDEFPEGIEPDTLKGDLWEIKNLAQDILNGEDRFELSQSQREKVLKHFAYERALTSAIEDQVKSEDYYFNDKGKELLAKILYHTGSLLIDLENVVYFND